MGTNSNWWTRNSPCFAPVRGLSQTLVSVGGRVHSLEGVLSLRVLGLMANCRSLSGIRRFGELHPEALQGLKLRRSPFVPTPGRALRQVA